MRTRKKSLNRLFILLSIFAALLYYFFMPPLATLKLYKEYYRPFQKHSGKIMLLHYGGMGEKEFAARFKIACQNMNIELQVFNTNTNLDQKKSKILMQRLREIVKIYKPDFVLLLEDLITEHFPGAPNYRILTRGGNNRYITMAPTGRFSFTFPYFKRADGLLTAFEDATLLEKAYIEDGGRLFTTTPWHMTVYNTDYAPTVPHKLFYSGGHLWDTTRNSEKYLQLFKLLDQSAYFKVCGVAENWQHTPRSFTSELPIDGQSVIKAIHEAGVSLILHDKEHLIDSVPSSRIFEAAAANAVIISDRHPFIEKYFGSNVLYIDVAQDAQNMFKQIDRHMQWILANPQSAQILAQNCNTIFKQKFLLEDQLQKLYKLDKNLKNYKQFAQELLPSKKLPKSQLPSVLKNDFELEKLPALWAMINVQNNKFKFYFNKLAPPNNSSPWITKLFILSRHLDHIVKNGGTIANGTYLVSLEDGIHVNYPWPVLAFAGESELVAQQKVILMPDNDALNGYDELFNSIDKAKQRFAWPNKQKQIFWRGQSTGLEFQVDKTKMFPRLEFMHKTLSLNYVNAGFTHFTNDIDPSVFKEITAKFPIRDFISPAESLKFKYLLDIDGHSCSYSRMAWILYSNSLLLKHQSAKMQWYYDKLQPYEHYLPIAADFSNIDAQYKWAETHPQEVQRMIRKAQKLAQETFNQEAIAQATQYAFLKYNLLVNSNP